MCLVHVTMVTYPGYNREAAWEVHILDKPTTKI